MAEIMHAVGNFRLTVEPAAGLTAHRTLDQLLQMRYRG
jgi:hypothetical protein